MKTKTEIFISKANEKHNNKYDYSKVKYNKASDEIVINCPIHGDFEQRAVNHLSGSGCNTCGIELTGHSKTAFKENCNRNNKGFGILYVIRCFNDTESFYKVGITSLSIKIRFKKDMPYNYEVIKQIIDEPIIIFNLENKLLSLTSEYRYEPMLSFGGQTECFSNLDSIKQYLI